MALLSILALLLAVPAFSQDATVAAPASGTGYDYLQIILVVVLGVLAFVIWGLARVLLMLARQVVIKTKTPKVLPVLLVLALLLAAQFASAQDDASQKAAQEVTKAGNLLAPFYYVLYSVLAVELIIVTFLIVMIKRFTEELLPEKKRKLASESVLKRWWIRFGNKLTKAVPLANEEEVVMDHEYDGIRELDNALPPWWKYGFYITIGVAIVYFLNYSVLGYGKNPTQEYAAQMAQAQVEKENYEANNKDKIDENNVPMANAAGLTAAKEIFTTKCFACHGKQGEGGAGPNLTDDYWLHKGSLNDVYQSIKHGYPDKGMQAWSTVYTPKEISFLASYIETLHGTNPPNAKAPQGDLYSNAPGGTSSTTASSDSALKK
ncbi:MAG: c-type cytochrome [Bacteroidota bacterium]|nr:c-type cytochrome [Bacteroidota bacterium]